MRIGAAAYLTCLIEAARTSPDPVTRWLCAERLVFFSKGRDPGLLLLRADSLANLGEPQAARQDVLDAFRLEPSLPGLADGVLPAISSTQDRKMAALHRLRAGGEPDESVFLALRDAGTKALLVAEAADGVISGRLWWTGTAPAAVTLHHQGGHDSVTLSAPVSSGRPGFTEVSDFQVPWPQGAGDAWFCAPGTLIVPEALVSHERPRFTPSRNAPSGGLLVIVPAFSDAPMLARCLDSVIPQLADGRRCIIVDDATPDQAVRALLCKLDGVDGVTVIRTPRNLGFAGAVNRGLAQRVSGEDVLLLNSDAILPQGALTRLMSAARSSADIATLTPFSNNGEDTSVPNRFQSAMLPDEDLLERLDAAASAANGGMLTEIPNGIGFCLYVTTRTLERVGGLCGSFERGYFEDVDVCLKAVQSGLRNYCTPGIYVAHAGSRSFGGEKHAYVRRNYVRLKALHPEYEVTSAAYAAADPLHGPSQAMAGFFLAANPQARVLIAPSDCPRTYALSIAGSPSPQVLIWPHGDNWRIEHQSPSFPFVLEVPRTGLQSALPWLADSHVAVIDEARLDRCWLEVIRDIPRENLTAKSESRSVYDGYPFSRIGVAAPEMSQATFERITGLLARCPESCLVLIDSPSTDIEYRLLDPARLMVAGSLADRDVQALLKRLRIDALIFADSIYGGFDVRRHLARAAGIPVYDLV